MLANFGDTECLNHKMMLFMLIRFNYIDFGPSTLGEWKGTMGKLAVFKLKLITLDNSRRYQKWHQLKHFQS